MSVNRHRPHVWVLPEDDANRQLAIEFLVEVDSYLQAGVLQPAGGWTKVLETFKSVHVVEMQKYPDRFMVLLIDSDDDIGRIAYVKTEIPGHLAERVFILGALSEPEDLERAGLGSYDDIGAKMAKDCREDTDTIGGHELLRHNARELDRLLQDVRPILFPSI